MLIRKQSISSSVSRVNGRSWRRGIGGAGTIVLGIAMLASVASAKGGASDEAGKSLFKANCVVCHGDDGAGTATGRALNAPDLHSEAVQKLTDAQITDQINNGKNNMPPFRNSLSQAQIKQLVSYVRTFGRKK